MEDQREQKTTTFAHVMWGLWKFPAIKRKGWDFFLSVTPRHMTLDKLDFGDPKSREMIFMSSGNRKEYFFTDEDMKANDWFSFGHAGHIFPD